MNVIISTLIGFSIPEESEAAEKFEAENDMTEWTKEETTFLVMYKKTNRYSSARGKE